MGRLANAQCPGIVTTLSAVVPVLILRILVDTHVLFGKGANTWRLWLGGDFKVVTGAALIILISQLCYLSAHRFVWLSSIRRPSIGNHDVYFQSFNKFDSLWLSLYTACNRWESRSTKREISLKTFLFPFFPGR